MQFFITYVLGYTSDSGKKAESGTMVHKAMEVLSALKKYQQDKSKNTKWLTVEDSAIGIVKVSRDDFLTSEFVESLLDQSYSAYKKDSKHSWTASDRKHLSEVAWLILKHNDGQFDPRFRRIHQTEPHFDIPIEEDWAKFDFVDSNGKHIKGQLAIKGTIDLVTTVDDDTIEVIDWKGLPIATKIPTPEGWTTMGKIQVGDTVFDQKGECCTVVGKSKVKTKNCFEIVFDDTSAVICDDEHLWKLSGGETVSIKDLRVGDKINVPKPIDVGYVDLPINPYLLGLWLGDGRNRSCDITGGDIEVFSRLQDFGFKLGSNTEKRSTTLQSRTILGQTGSFRDLGLLNNKHIPEVYFRASYEQRLELLRGLMDSDGNVNIKRKQAVFTSCRKRLSDDVKHLLLTLGQRPLQSVVHRDTNFKKDVTIYPISFRPIEINPFFIERKASQIDPKWGVGRSDVRKVVSIIPAKQQETQCISVDSPDNTYLCTENYIPTHNTGRRLDWATMEEKDYEKLSSDPQLLLYFYAMSKMYPTFKYRIMSIFFCKDKDGNLDPKPFSFCFAAEDEARFLAMLKKRVEEIRANNAPALLDHRRQNFKCKSLCHFCKNKWPGTDENMCIYIEKHIKEHGMQETVSKCTKPGFHIGFYEAPG
jgi:hypothetical protein